MARLTLLDHVPVLEGNIHPIRCAGDPHVAATRYEESLRAEFGRSECLFDLLLLGMGSDGHTLSLFPASPALHEHLRWTAVVRKEGEDIDRVTLTLPAVELARRVVFLVAGPDKRSMLTLVQSTVDVPAAQVAAAARDVEWLVA